MLKFKISREFKNKPKMNMGFDNSSCQGAIREREMQKRFKYGILV